MAAPPTSTMAQFRKLPFIFQVYLDRNALLTKPFQGAIGSVGSRMLSLFLLMRALLMASSRTGRATTRTAPSAAASGAPPEAAQSLFRSTFPAINKQSQPQHFHREKLFRVFEINAEFV